MVISTKTAILIACMLQKVVSSSAAANLWAIKSHQGGGYASRAMMYNPIHGSIVISGTMWDIAFLELLSESVDSAGPIDGASTCYIGSIQVDNPKQGAPKVMTTSKSLAPPQACGAMALLRPLDGTKALANPTQNLNIVHVIDDASALLLGYERFSEKITRTLRVQEGMTLVNLQNYITRQEELETQNKIDSPTIDSTLGSPSLHDGLDATSTLNGWNDIEHYQHQSLPFTYPMAAVAERSIYFDSNFHGPKGESHNIFVAITQSAQIPSFYNLESIMTDDAAAKVPLKAMLPEFYFRQVAEIDYIRTGKADFDVPVTGGIQKIDAASGIIQWHTPIMGESGYEGDVMVTDVAYFPMTRYGEFVVIVGSVKGASGPLLGTAYGNPTRGGKTDWDGFITKINAQTGKVWSGQGGQDASYRIQSLANHNDWVTAMCFQQPDIAYVIGNTEGKIASNHLDEEGGAFVMKVDIDAMDVHWKIQLEGLGVLATACAMPEVPIPGQAHLLYVGGVLPTTHPGLDLEGNKLISKGDKERISDDAFVVAIDAFSNNGEIQWIREIEYEQGGRRHESISSLSVDDTNGHVITFGNSYDPVAQQNDIFVVAIEGQNGVQAGDLDSITKPPITPVIPTKAPVRPPTATTPKPTRTPTKAPVAVVATTPTQQSLGNDSANSESNSDSGAVLIAAIVLPILLIGVIVIVINLCLRPSKEDMESDLESDAVPVVVTDDPPGVSKPIV